MKKVILSLVFVLATGISFMNANSNNEIYILGEPCYEKADRMAIHDAVQNNYQLWQENLAFELYYDNCMKDNDDEFVFPDL
jgi:hypothetical protein